MTNWTTIWLCARVNLLKWSVTPRMYTIAAIILAFAIWIFAWISDYASAVGVNVTPWVFPYLLTMPIIFMIYGVLTTLLFSDAPFTDSHTPFLMVRTSRRNWVLGQLLYILITSFLYTAFFVLMSMVVLIPNLKFSLDWGAVLKTLAYDPGSPAKYNIESYSYIKDPVISMFSAMEAMLISFGLFWLVSLFMGVLIFCFNVVLGRLSGLIAAGVFTCIAYFAVYVGKLSFGNMVYYISPLSWTSMFYLDWGNTSSMPTPLYAISCLFGAIVLMSIISVKVYCMKDVDVQERRSSL
ncbi:hypothetical protein ACK8P5_02830 [Paenibacillus sp. EC2-1]|uniref:hypothetical protein n=1 Tax=Paenibacillus sp. EC2-1 TaxID=3388665 RepID=UPI003BEF1E30